MVEEALRGRGEKKHLLLEITRLLTGGHKTYSWKILTVHKPDLRTKAQTQKILPPFTFEFIVSNRRQELLAQPLMINSNRVHY